MWMEHIHTIIYVFFFNQTHAKHHKNMVFVVSIRDFPEKIAVVTKEGDTFLDLFNNTKTLASINVSPESIETIHIFQGKEFKNGIVVQPSMTCSTANELGCRYILFPLKSKRLQSVDSNNNNSHKP